MTRNEALARPQRALLNAHFVIYPASPRKWVIEGIDGGMCPSYWRVIGSAEAAKDIVIREMERQITHLNDYVNVLRQRAEQPAENS